MPRLTPEEVLEKFGHHTIQPLTLCQVLCQEFQNLEDVYQQNPSPVLEKRLLALAKQLQASHCRCSLQ